MPTKKKVQRRFTKDSVGNIHACTRTEICNIFQVSTSAVFKWHNENDAPKKNDGTWDLLELINWYFKRSHLPPGKANNPKLDAEIKKLENQNTKLELEIDALTKKSMSREDVEEMFHTNAKELMTYLTNGYKQNATLMLAKLGLGADRLTEFHGIIDDFVTQAMKAFSLSGEDIT